MAKKRVQKKRLVGYTKVKKRYALVFKKGNKMSVSTSTYKTKASLSKAAQKHL